MKLEKYMLRNSFVLNFSTALYGATTYNYIGKVGELSDSSKIMIAGSLSMLIGSYVGRKIAKSNVIKIANIKCLFDILNTIVYSLGIGVLITNYNLALYIIAVSGLLFSVSRAVENVYLERGLSAIEERSEERADLRSKLSMNYSVSYSLGIAVNFAITKGMEMRSFDFVDIVKTLIVLRLIMSVVDIIVTLKENMVIKELIGERVENKNIKNF